MKNYKTIKKSYFTQLRESNKLTLLEAYSSVTTNCYEYGDDLVFENFMLKQYWIHYNKQEYFNIQQTLKRQQSPEFLHRWDVQLASTEYFLQHKDDLLDFLYAELKIKPAQFTEEVMAHGKFEFVDRAIKKYGYSNAYEKLELGLAVLIAELANNRTSGTYKVDTTDQGTKTLKLINHYGEHDLFYRVNSGLKDKFYTSVQVAMLLTKGLSVEYIPTPWSDSMRYDIHYYDPKRDTSQSK